MDGVRSLSAPEYRSRVDRLYRLRVLQVNVPSAGRMRAAVDKDF